MDKGNIMNMTIKQVIEMCETLPAEKCSLHCPLRNICGEMIIDFKENLNKEYYICEKTF